MGWSRLPRHPRHISYDHTCAWVVQRGRAHTMFLSAKLVEQLGWGAVHQVRVEYDGQALLLRMRPVTDADLQADGTSTLRILFDRRQESKGGSREVAVGTMVRELFPRGYNTRAPLSWTRENDGWVVFDLTPMRIKRGAQ